MNTENEERLGAPAEATSDTRTPAATKGPRTGDQSARLARRQQSYWDEMTKKVEDVCDTLPDDYELVSLLEVPDDLATWRIENILPTGGNVLLAAQYKAGKTTMVANLVRALADGDPFLGRFNVAAPADNVNDNGRVTVLDTEMRENTIKRWYRDQGIEATAAVSFVPLKGRLREFDILDENCRAAWAAKLAMCDTDVLVFDCLRPAMDALGLSEDKDAGRFLVALDRLKYQAGISEVVVVHHMGHGSTRARGDSRLMDWPDVNWRIYREGENGPRRFAASGRDVDVPESPLHYDPAMRRYVIADHPQVSPTATAAERGRDDAAAANRLHQILLDLRGGLTTRAAVAELRSTGLSETAARAAVKEAIANGAVHRKPGSRQSKILTANAAWEATHAD